MNRLDLLARASRLPGWAALQHVVQNRRYQRWLRNGMPLPPPSRVKQQILRQLAAEHELSILVETGTFLGDMLHALRNDFSRLYSIELSPSLYVHAQRRFRRVPHIKLVLGDSGKQLGKLLPEINAPTLFWLDGHYSGTGTAHGVEATPIMLEIQALAGIRERAVVAIDDARCFGSDAAYPTRQGLCDYLQHLFPCAKIEEQYDILILTGLQPTTQP